MTHAQTDRDNAVRLRTSPKGHVESHFVKANSPDGRRAFWLKHTLLVPPTAMERGVGEVWAVTFERSQDGRTVTKRGGKHSFALSDIRYTEAPFLWVAPAAELGCGRAKGELSLPGLPQIRWDLQYESPSPAFRPFPSPRMYTGNFPRSKALTPYPDARFSGSLSVQGERWNATGFAGCQGHNWGVSHAHGYGWAHGNIWRLEGEAVATDGVWLEVLTGKVRTGPLVTPWLTTAAACVDKTLVRFDGPRAMLRGDVQLDHQSLRATLRQGDNRLEARFWTSADAMAGLRYEDPDGRALACLNSKLASGEFRLITPERTWTFTSDAVALEIGTRKAGHGVTMLA